MDTPPASLFTDGQIAALVSALGAGFLAVAGAIKWGVGRLVRSIDIVATKSEDVRETLVAVTHELRETRDDVAELRTAKGSAGRKRDTPARTPPIGIRRATTDTD